MSELRDELGCFEREGNFVIYAADMSDTCMYGTADETTGHSIAFETLRTSPLPLSLSHGASFGHVSGVGARRLERPACFGSSPFPRTNFRRPEHARGRGVQGLVAHLLTLSIQSGGI